MNRVTLCGRVGRDPELKMFSNGGKIAVFSLATSEKWRDKSTGERKEKTEWHTIVVQNEGLCGVVEQYVSKGTQLLIEGKIQTRKWQDQSGNDRYSTEIVIPSFGGSIQLLGGGGNGESGGGSRRERDDDDEVPF